MAHQEQYKEVIRENKAKTGGQASRSRAASATIDSAPSTSSPLWSSTGTSTSGSRQPVHIVDVEEMEESLSTDEDG